MISSSMMEAVKEAIEATGLLPTNTQVQLTPDERPYPSSGQCVITIFPDELFNPKPAEWQRGLLQSIKICITKRVGTHPTDRLYKTLYLESLTSLSALSNILYIILDRNIYLSQVMVTKITTSVNTLLARLTEIESDPDTPLNPYQKILRASLQQYQLVEVPIVASVNMAPIPRFPDFFGAYDGKESIQKELKNDTIEPAGYSILITLTGPRLMLPQACLTDEDLAVS